MATKPVTEQPRGSGSKGRGGGGGQYTPPRTTEEDERLEEDWDPCERPLSEGQGPDGDTTPKSRAHLKSPANQSTDFSEVDELLKQVEDLQATQKKMMHEQKRLKKQLKEKNEEIARLCERRGAEDVLQSGEYHSARSTPYTSMESDRDASSRPATGPQSREGRILQFVQELDDSRSQISRLMEENAELSETVDKKHKRIVDLENRLDQATELQPVVEHLTMELSKYQQGGEEVGRGKRDSSKEPSQPTPHEKAYEEKLRREVDTLRPYKSRAEEAEKNLQTCEKEYRLERKNNAKLQHQIDALKSEITNLKSGSGSITKIDDFEVVDAASGFTEQKASWEGEEEGRGVKERGSKREKEPRQEAMAKEQNKEWKRSLSENDQELEKKMRERDREWEQRLQEKQREWEERVQKLQKEREVKLQGKKKEICDLKSKVKELEKAAALLGKVQHHSKGQDHQLMQLQDEAKRLQEKQHEWEEKQREWGKRVEKLQKEREVELQGKKKEIHDLKSKVKELEKAAALLGRVQQHSKGQSLQLLQLQDEAKVKEAKDIEVDDIRRSMQQMQDLLYELETQNQKLVKERGKLREEISRLERQKSNPKELAKEQGQWKKAKLKLEGQVSKLEADILLRIQEKERAQNELDSVTSHYNELKRENQSFKNELKWINDENRELSIKVTKLTQVTEKLTEERDALRDNLQTTEAQASADFLEQTGGKDYQQKQRGQDEKDQNGEKEKYDKNVFREDFEAERSDRERAHAQRNEEGERYRQEISRLQSELEHTRKKLKSHKGNLSGLEDIHQRRQKELMQALEQLKAAQEEVQAKTSQVKQYKKQHDQATAQIVELQLEDGHLKQEMGRLRMELEKAMNQFSKEKKNSNREMSTQIEQAELREQCKRLQDCNDVEVSLSHADDYTRDNPENESRPRLLVSQGTAGKESDQCSVSHGMPQEQSTLAYLHHEDLPMTMAPVSQRALGQLYSQQDGHCHVQQKEQGDSLRIAPQHADYVNQSRVQAMIEESKARQHQHLVSPESALSAPMPVELHFDLPPPIVSYFEELTNNESHDPAAAMNEGSPYLREDQHVRTNLLYIPSSQTTPHEHQFTTTNPEHNPQQHASQKKQNYPVNAAHDSADKMGTENPVTGLQAPIEPNLICGICGRVFQRGEIQLYRRHVGSCGIGSDV